VEKRTIVRVVEATGHLDARSRVEVAPPVAGHLAEIKVAPGDVVEKGQLLAKLDDRATALGVRGAGATLEASVWRVAEVRAAADSAEQEMRRVERLKARGLASAQDLDAAKAALERARAVVKAADAEKSLAADNVAVAKVGHNLGDIVSPIAGIVLSAPENAGVGVSPERGALFVVATPLDAMRIDADVSEADIGEVHVGQTAHFEVQTFPGREFTAKVERIGLDSKREGAVVTYTVMLTADNHEKLLLPGMTAAVRIEIATAKDAVAVREAALRFTPAGADPAEPRTRVWRRRTSSELEPITVKLGLSDGAYTEVHATPEDALQPGDPVVVGLLQKKSDDAAKPGVSLGNKK
jgi:HlyD family secretion protein